MVPMAALSARIARWNQGSPQGNLHHNLILIQKALQYMLIRVFHENTFSKEKVVHTLTCPSGGYTSQIQKLFLFGQV